MKYITTGFLNDTVHGLKINSSYPCISTNYYKIGGRTLSYVVMHYTGNTKDNAINNVKYYNSSQASAQQASAHLFVDDNSIYQSVKLCDSAWHCGTKGTYYCGARNANSIGIEMCCTAGNYTVSDKTIENAAYLCAFCCQYIGITADEVDTYVVRHYDVTHKECPRQMVRNPQEWVDFKQKVKNILLTGKMEKEVIVPEPVVVVPTKGEEEMTQEKFEEMLNVWLQKQNTADPSAWSADARAWAEEIGVIQGDGNNLAYKKFITKEEATAMLYKLFKKIGVK